MVMIDASKLDDLAWGFHYHAESTIELEELEKRGWASIEHILEIRQQISYYIAMWEDTYRDMDELLIEMRKKEMSE